MTMRPSLKSGRKLRPKPKKTAPTQKIYPKYASLLSSDNTDEEDEAAIPKNRTQFKNDFKETEFSNILHRQREIFNSSFGTDSINVETKHEEPQAIVNPSTTKGHTKFITPLSTTARPTNIFRRKTIPNKPSDPKHKQHEKETCLFQPKNSAVSGSILMTKGSITGTIPNVEETVFKLSEEDPVSILPEKESILTSPNDVSESILSAEKEVQSNEKKRKAGDNLESSSKISKKSCNKEKLKDIKKSKVDCQDKKSSSFLAYETKVDEGVKSKVFKCKICDKESFAKADLMKHIRVHTGERPYKCKICKASFVQITALRGHETIHTGNKPFVCDVCGKKFAIKDRLRLHMRVHTGEKPHKCKLCDISFARRSQVSQHMRIHDTEKAKFACEECGSSFSSYHTLKAHTNGHLGIKEFQCCACGKKFLRVEGMYKHIRTVHRGSRPYTCNICGKAFKGHLQQHMRLHRGVRPYTCHLCDAAFTQNSQLTVHLRIHTGERPYKCQVCGSSFAHSSACKIHMRSHTGEKPFRCVVCRNAFSQLPHLKKHMKCVHGADKPYMCTLCNDFFKTQAEIDSHRRYTHKMIKTAEEEAQETVEDATLARLRNRLAVLLYRISSEDRRSKFGFGTQLIDEVLKLSLQSSGHTPMSDPSIAPLEELRQNVLTLLRWTIPQETMEEYHKNKMTVDEVLDLLTS